MLNSYNAETATQAPEFPTNEHEKTTVEISASIPGYRVGFFVSHETSKNSSKTNSPRLDITIQKAVN